MAKKTQATSVKMWYVLIGLTFIMGLLMGSMVGVLLGRQIAMNQVGSMVDINTQQTTVNLDATRTAIFEQNSQMLTLTPNQ